MRFHTIIFEHFIVGFALIGGVNSFGPIGLLLKSDFRKFYI